MIERNKTDSDLIDQWRSKHLGYGNIESDVWYVGLGEAGKCEEEIHRATAWEKLQGLEILDCVEFHREFSPKEYERRFNECGEVALQPTWRPLIILHLALKGINNSDKSALRKRQGMYWGRASGDHLLLEVVGGATPTMSQNGISCERVQRIGELIQTRQPALVIFYGKGMRCLRAWEQISKNKFSFGIGETHVMKRRSRTLFVCIPHPARPGKGFTNEKWQEIGSSIRAELTNSTRT